MLNNRIIILGGNDNNQLTFIFELVYPKKYDKVLFLSSSPNGELITELKTKLKDDILIYNDLNDLPEPFSFYNDTKLNTLIIFDLVLNEKALRIINKFNHFLNPELAPDELPQQDDIKMVIDSPYIDKTEPIDESLMIQTNPYLLMPILTFESLPEPKKLGMICLVSDSYYNNRSAQLYPNGKYTVLTYYNGTNWIII